MSQRVTFAYPVTVDGRDHKPDSTAEVPDHVAADLLASGKARKADATKQATTNTAKDK